MFHTLILLAQIKHNELLHSRLSVSDQICDAMESVSGQKSAQLQVARQALVSASEEGFRHLEEEHRLQEISRALEAAVAGIQAAEKRAATVQAVRDTMHQRLLSVQHGVDMPESEVMRVSDCLADD